MKKVKFDITKENKEFKDDEVINQNKQEKNTKVNLNNINNTLSVGNTFNINTVSSQTIFVTKNFKEVPICNQDKINMASYICAKCKLFWCNSCMKFEVHKQNLIHLDQLNYYLATKRKSFQSELENTVMTDQYFPHLERIEFILSERISDIEKHFSDMISIITKIKEVQSNFLKEHFFKEINSPKFKSLTNEIKFFQDKLKETHAIEEKEKNLNVVDYLNNNDKLEQYKNSISENFSEFKQKFNNFQNIFVQYDNFNLTLISQLEGKFKLNDSIKNLLQNPENLNKISKEDSENKIQAKKTSINLNGIDNTNYYYTRLFKVKYYNTILEWDHLKQKMIRIDNFKDSCEFKMNYQVYSGNIFLNHTNKLFIVTGINYNFFYYYYKETNEVYRLPDLCDNHCRGSLVYVKRLNSIICISGKYTNKCEKFVLDNLNSYKISDISNTNINKDNVIQTTGKTPIIPYNKWEEFPQLNYQRYYSAVYVFNDQYIYIFFGYNSVRGGIDTVERINTANNSNDNYWEIVNYSNPTSLDLRINSHSCIYANLNEIYIAGGSINDKFSDKIFKYNLIRNSLYQTDLTIPDININEYFRFWEESQFKPLTILDSIDPSTNDEYTFAIFDARDKLHFFNSRTFKYKII